MWYALDASGVGHVHVSTCCEQDNGLSVSIIGVVVGCVLELLGNCYWLWYKYPVPWMYLVVQQTEPYLAVLTLCK